jgi:hypothetical protein
MAVRRLRRTLIIWALIYTGIALLSFFALRQNYPLAFLPWFIGAVLFVTRVEPIYLSLVAVQWGISLITLIPGVSYFIGPDPLSFIFDSGFLEILVLIGVRLVFIFTSFNQFLFYRLLYGSEKMTGASDDLPDIPEVIPNRSNRFAALSRILGLGGMFIAIAALSILRGDLVDPAISLAIYTGTYAIGFGLGAAFSPTDRRSVALSGVGFGSLAILMALIISRVI